MTIGQLTDDLITNQQIVGQVPTDTYHARLIYLLFDHYTGGRLTPTSAVIKLNDENKTEVTITNEWTQFTFGVKSGESPNYLARARLNGASLEIQGTTRSAGTIESVYSFRMKSVTENEETYTQFYYKQ